MCFTDRDLIGDRPTPVFGEPSALEDFAIMGSVCMHRLMISSHRIHNTLSKNLLSSGYVGEPDSVRRMMPRMTSASPAPNEIPRVDCGRHPAEGSALLLRRIDYIDLTFHHGERL